MSTQHPDGENPQMPHSVQPVQAAANTQAVQRARNQATVVDAGGRDCRDRAG